MSNWCWVGLALGENLDMTRLTLSVPQGSGRKTFKGLPMHSSAEGRKCGVLQVRHVTQEEVGNGLLGGGITQGGFPTWFHWICYWHCITLYACCEFAIEGSSYWLVTDVASVAMWLLTCHQMRDLVFQILRPREEDFYLMLMKLFPGLLDLDSHLWEHFH